MFQTFVVRNQRGVVVATMAAKDLAADQEDLPQGWTVEWLTNGISRGGITLQAVKYYAETGHMLLKEFEWKHIGVGVDKHFVTEICGLKLDVWQSTTDEWFYSVEYAGSELTKSTPFQKFLEARDASIIWVRKWATRIVEATQF